MDNVAVFVSHYSLGNSPSILNFLDLMSCHFRVTLFLENVDLVDVELLGRPTIHVVTEGIWRRQKSWRQRLRSVFSCFRYYVVFDPYGFCLCKLLFPSARPVYYSLELYMREDHFGLDYSPEVMRCERAHIGEIRGLIIQSREKELLFRKDYEISDRIPCLLLPVTYQGPSESKKSSALRVRYGVSDQQSIALHLGGIAVWHSSIEIAKVFGRLNEWVLVFQGYPDPAYERELREVINKGNITNVFVHEARFKHLKDVEEIVRSCDVGIAWYNDISIGFRTAGLSSGKIPSYLRFGLPVIAKAYPSTVEAVERTGCGVCVEKVEDIPQALTTISQHYNDYSQAALLEYSMRYQFDRYKTRILNFLETVSA